ncbi:MAG: ribosome assembly RNA-binding protein YhbY [Gammaproteobacteria bacterium]|nr:MAG: ribosome assembly RNA-binding protein YhbY [Gammaproteobacteria bacterium]PIE34721.1 MAG: ribosome assembly RNA-binding protein YhbY [Gammaproteobacteria bacterium]
MNDKTPQKPDYESRKPLGKQQKKYLKGLAHTLDPVVRIGQKGLTEAVLAELEIALDHHELVKINLAGAREERARQLDALCKATLAEPVQQIGHTATVYRPNPQHPRIQFES